MHTNFFVLLIFILKRCETRSVSIVVQHQQFFEVQDVENTGFIQVPETYERLLQLANPENKAASNEDSASTDKDPGHTDDAKRPINHWENNRDSQRDKNDDGDDDDDDDDSDDDDDDGDDEDENYDEVEQDELNDSAVGDFVSADLKENEYSKIDDLDDNKYHIERVSGLRKTFRKKRSAHEQWKSSLPGAEPVKTTEDVEPDVWEEVTDADLQKAQIHTYKQVAIYLGWTLLSVVIFAIVGICFLRDPIACIFAFGTGCPCCLICCPCIRSFTDKYLDTKRIVREQVNKYMPGIIVNEDGTLEHYEPTGDELDLLVDIIDEMQD